MFSRGDRNEIGRQQQQRETEREARFTPGHIKNHIISQHALVQYWGFLLLLLPVLLLLLPHIHSYRFWVVVLDA